MGIVQTLEKYLIKFGANNSPTFVAMSIATAKGIFRPAFTMSDNSNSYILHKRFNQQKHRKKNISP